MYLAISGFLLLLGLSCFWASLESLTRIDRLQSATPEPKIEPDEKEEEAPQLTRLGRPIEEIRLRA